MITTDIKDININKVFPSTLISDSFEAVTNGMSNPEALERLEFCKDDSKLYPWYLIIKSIQAFYNQDFTKMENLLNALPPDSSAGSLKKVLLLMAGKIEKGSKLSRAEDQLVKTITTNIRFFKSALSEIKEALNYGEDIFIETVSPVIKEIKNESLEAAERLTLWAFQLCLDKNYNEEPLADNIIMIFGETEGLRLIGLALLESDPVTALICFTRSLIARLSEKSIDLYETQAYLEILESLSSTCSKDDPAIKDIYELFSLLEYELKYSYINTGISDKSAILKIDNLKDFLKPEKEKKNKFMTTSFNKIQKKEVVQLELF